MIKFVEIYESSAGYDDDIGKCKTNFSLRELYLNPSYIISMKRDTRLQAKSKSGEVVNGLDKNASFSELTVAVPGHNSKTFSVIGHPDSFLSKLGKFK
jgi:hypothetical protein